MYVVSRGLSKIEIEVDPTLEAELSLKNEQTLNLPSVVVDGEHLELVLQLVPVLALADVVAELGEGDVARVDDDLLHAVRLVEQPAAAVLLGEEALRAHGRNEVRLVPWRTTYVD